MLKRVINIALVALLGTVVIMLLSVTVLPRVAGWQFLTVLSPSMTPALDVGGIVAVVPTDPATIQVDDILVYRPPTRQSVLVTHRVIERSEEGGRIVFRTQGDANNVADSYAVPASSVLGTVKLHIPLAGYILSFVRTPAGFLLLLVLPGLVLVGMEVAKIGREIRVSKRSGQAV